MRGVTLCMWWCRPTLGVVNGLDDYMLKLAHDNDSCDATHDTPEMDTDRTGDEPVSKKTDEKQSETESSSGGIFSSLFGGCKSKNSDTQKKGKATDSVDQGKESAN
eukprot:m.1346857 g.1346857  ORF g.1346857 m.1346857 type:complete len:106 (+) comp24907_c0_seq18:294-611(+)